MHLARNAVKRSTVLNEMEVYGNLELTEAVVELYKIVEGYELSRKDQTVAVHKNLKVYVLLVLFVVLIKQHHMKVLLSVPKLVLVVFQIPVFKLSLYVDLRSSERSIIDEWQYVIVVYSRFNNLSPHCRFTNVAEKHIINGIEQGRVVQGR